MLDTGVATDNVINLGVREGHDAGYFIELLKKIANEIVSVNALLTVPGLIVALWPTEK